MTTPAPASDDPAAGEAALVAAVLGLLAVGASASALAGALARLLRVRRSAAAAAVSVIGYRPGEYRPPFSPAAPTPQPGTATPDASSAPADDSGGAPEPSTVARDIAVRAERSYRAAFLARSAQRIEKAVAAGKPLHAASEREKDLWRLHEDAYRRRRLAAARVDEAVDRHGLVLSWRAVIDKRTSMDCRAANGRNFRVDRPPRLGFPGAAHPRCLLPGSVVSAAGIRATSTRWYDGEVVEVLTDSGNLLTVTPNHPVLTPKGWIPAGLLNEGSDVVSTEFPETLTRLVGPHDYQVPALVEDVAATFGERLGVSPMTVPVAAEDFHGDGFGSEVAVIRAYRVLRDGRDPAEAQPGVVEQFERVASGFPVSLRRGSALLLERVPGATNRVMSRLDIARMLLRRALAAHQSVGIRDASPRDVRLLQNVANPVARHAVGTGELSFAHPGEVRLADVAGGQHFAKTSRRTACTRKVVGRPLATESPTFSQRRHERSLRNVELIGDGPVSAVAALVRLDRVRQVRKWSSWSGHVYNLETSAGWYVSGNFVTHNCRCTPGPPNLGAGWVDFAPAAQRGPGFERNAAGG